jgi:hypothetical protein
MHACTPGHGIMCSNNEFISFSSPLNLSIPSFRIRHMQADPELEETGPGPTEVAAVDLGAASVVGGKASSKAAGKGSRGARGKGGGGAVTTAVGDKTGSRNSSKPRKNPLKGKWI